MWKAFLQNYTNHENVIYPCRNYLLANHKGFHFQLKEWVASLRSAIYSTCQICGFLRDHIFFFFLPQWLPFILSSWQSDSNKKASLQSESKVQYLITFSGGQRNHHFTNLGSRHGLSAISDWYMTNLFTSVALNLWGCTPRECNLEINRSLG